MEIRRRVKNVVYKYSEPERLVREATSNDPWGPTSTVMSELAEMSFDAGCCEEILTIIWKRLNDKGKNWRHVYKCLILLEYLIKCGDQKVATVCLNNIHCIETLKDFIYFEEHKDLGFGVREKSKALVSLLKDDEVLSIERQKGQKIKAKFHGPRSALGSQQRRRQSDSGRDMRRQSFDKELKFHKPVMKLNFEESKHTKEDADLKKAIALSKEEHELSTKKRMEEDFREEMKIKMALEQSKKEEELYKLSVASRAFEEINGFGELDNDNIRDPWGSPTTTYTRGSISLDFDPRRTSAQFSPPPYSTISESTNVWNNQNDTPNKNMINDIFGDGNLNTQFDSNWRSNNAGTKSFGEYEDDHGAKKTEPLLDIWESEPWSSEPTVLSKNTMGSLSSLTDLGLNFPPEDPLLYSSSAMNLAATNATKKTPQEFLGENAKLVNLDNLLPTPTAGVYRDAFSYAQKNPFGSSSAVTINPFNSQTIQIKTPMNQMGPGALHGNMFTSPGNTNAINTNFNYDTFSQMPQPVIPISQSQYHTLSTSSTPYNSGVPMWTPQPILTPSNQWLSPTNNVPTNPFLH